MPGGANGDHLTVRCWIEVCPNGIVPLADQLAVTVDDHRTERRLAARHCQLSLSQREPHEVLVLSVTCPDHLHAPPSPATCQEAVSPARPAHATRFAPPQGATRYRQG